MIGFVPGRGWFYGLHPLTKMMVAVGLSVSAVLVPGPEGAFAVFVGTVVLLVVARVWGAFRPAFLLCAPFWVFLLVIHWGIRAQPEVAVIVGSRVSAVIFVFVTTMTSIHPGRLVESLVSIGAPFGMVYVMSATLLAIPRLQSQADAVLEAQQCRGLRVRRNLIGRMRALGPLVIPLVLGALTEVDDRAVALDTRAAAANIKRTPLDPPAHGISDYVLLILALGAVIGTAMLRFGS